MVHPYPGAARLRWWVTLLVALAASGLFVLASSYLAFNGPVPSPSPTSSNPTR